MEYPVGKKGLAILILNQRPSYEPGDTITGLVFRQVPVLVGERDVSITIQFKGEAAVTVTQWSDHTGESQRTFLLSFGLFDDSTSQTLHRGPLDIRRRVEGIADDELGPGGYEEGIGCSWPFTVVLPTQTQAVSLSFGGNIPQNLASETFRRLGLAVGEDGQGPPQFPPPSNHVDRREYAPYEFVGGGVDYCLEARLVSAHSQNMPVVRAPITIHRSNAFSRET